jgi:short-subunit dehydrogenase
MNKSVVVSGGTKGIGKSIVLKFLKEGYDVYTCSRNSTNIEHLKNDEKVKEASGKLFVFKADLSVKKEVDAFAEFVLSMTSSIHVLVNNSGSYVPGEIHQEEDGVLEHMIQTNLYSAYYLTRKLVKVFIGQKQGDIFTICSTASLQAYPNGGSYCISKFALYGMNKVLREEMKPYGVRVVSVLPGATLTSSWDGVDLPESRFMKSDDVANAIYSIHQLSGNTVVEDIVLRPQLGDL